MTTPAINGAALKEWAAIVQALLEGEQILDIRKGGLHEEGRHFQVSNVEPLWGSPWRAKIG